MNGNELWPAFYGAWICAYVCIYLLCCVTIFSLRNGPVYRAIHTTVTNYRILFLFLFLSLLISFFLS